MAVHDGLEARIGAQTDTEADRKAAYQQVRALEDDGSAEYALARAALAGRLAETRGAKAGKLVTEAEQFARLSLDRDRSLRDGAALRMLGTLYVLAPGRLLKQGDSEVGLEMLEDLVRSHPDDPRAQLRLAEAYLALGDPDPSIPHLCRAQSGREALPADERRLLGRLVDDAGGPSVVLCGGEA